MERKLKLNDGTHFLRLILDRQLSFINKMLDVYRYTHLTMCCIKTTYEDCLSSEYSIVKAKHCVNWNKPYSHYLRNAVMQGDLELTIYTALDRFNLI